MGQDLSNLADVPHGHDSPLNYAVSTRDRSIVEMVEEALREERVALAYQAIVPASTPAAPAYYEGLIRVIDPTGRAIPARDFIGAVEASETGRRIDCAALRAGLAALRRHPALRLAINMSARSIGYAPWADTLERGMTADPTVAERLILEITESSAILVPELVVSFMSRLQKAGIKLRAG